MAAPQSFKNHLKFTPIFHYVSVPLTSILLLWGLSFLVRSPSEITIFMMLIIVALACIGTYSRTGDTKLQDRIIRLEERLRLQSLLPAEQHARIADLSLPQLIALRFADDSEVPALVERVLGGELSEPKAIKQAIQNWRADHVRV